MKKLELLRIGAKVVHGMRQVEFLFHEQKGEVGFNITVNVFVPATDSLKEATAAGLQSARAFLREAADYDGPLTT